MIVYLNREKFLDGQLCKVSSLIYKVWSLLYILGLNLRSKEQITINYILLSIIWCRAWDFKVILTKNNYEYGNFTFLQF